MFPKSSLVPLAMLLATPMTPPSSNRKLDQLWFDSDGEGTHKAVMIADSTNDFKSTAAQIPDIVLRSVTPPS